MESQFKYNLEKTLDAPSGGALSAISATAEIKPNDAGCLIYGTLPNGNMGCIKVRGPKAEIELPFVHPKIFVKYLLGLKNFRRADGKTRRDDARGPPRTALARCVTRRHDAFCALPTLRSFTHCRTSVLPDSDAETRRHSRRAAFATG
jgi:hypothetical protein